MLRILDGLKRTWSEVDFCTGEWSLALRHHWFDVAHVLDLCAIF